MRIEIKDKKNFIHMFNDLFKNNQINNINAISIDSRKIEKGDIFIPIKGENYDGHEFISNALKSGAIKSFSENKEKNKSIINIKSSKDTIEILAKTWKKKSKHKIIGITGSNGKTSAKDLLAFILSKKFKCSKTAGNFNSSIGLPISYLSSKINDNYCIIEYGASKPNEIKNLCKIIKPNISLITNISNAHIENYNSIEEIAKTKNAIFECLDSNDTAFINLDDKLIVSNTKKYNKVTFSVNRKADYSISKFNRNKSAFLINKNHIEIPANLLHLKSLVLAVYAISIELGFNYKEINQIVTDFEIPEGRGKTININGIKIIDDSYNANPSSVLLAINRINSIETIRNKIFVFGDMHELGEKSITEHKKIAQHINSSNISIVITYGEFSYNTFINLNKSLTKKHFSDINKLKEYLKIIIDKGDLIYLKGSRTMKLERIYKAGLA